jgi:hypothetical protein
MAVYDLIRAISFATTYLLTEDSRRVALTLLAKSGLMRGEGNREMPSKRRTTMKCTTALTYLAATLISMGSACAHAQGPGFKVPFDFTVGNQVFPAGSYQVSYYPTKTAILIRSQDDDRFHAFAAIYSADPSTRDGKVVFTKYGNQYFLHEVLCSAVSMNVALPTSRLEKQVRIQEAQLPHSETVADLRTGAK